jgi:hypothetical protein
MDDELLRQYRRVAHVHEVRTLLITGSRARGNHGPDSDYDFIAVTADYSGFQCTSDDPLVEVCFLDATGARAKLERSPGHAYAFLDARLLTGFESDRTMLMDIADRCLAGYRSSRKELQGAAHWLRSSRTKLKNALAAGSETQMNWQIDSVAGELLCSIALLNDRPRPGNGNMFAEVGTVPEKPDFHGVFIGSATARAQCTLSCIEWALPLLLKKMESVNP